MRIAFLAPANSSHTHRWLRHFRHHEVLWLTLHEASDDLLPAPFPYAVLSARGPLRFLAAAYQARRELERFRPDVLHVHSMARYGLIGLLARFDPTVMTAWGSDVLHAGMMSRVVLRRMIRRARALTCDAEHMRKALIELGARDDDVHVIHFGVEVDTFVAATPEVRTALRRRHGYSEEPIVLSLRSLEPHYDVSTLIRAIPRVAACVPEARFLIAGDGSLAQSLHALARTLCVKERVHFLGQRSPDEVRELLQLADVYVSTSRADAGLAASAAEAMATSRVVVVSDSAENHLWVTHGVNGFLFTPGDDASLADLVVTALGEAADRLGSAARVTITTRNNVEIEMAKAEQLLVRIARG